MTFRVYYIFAVLLSGINLHALSSPGQQIAIVASTYTCSPEVHRPEDLVQASLQPIRLGSNLGFRSSNCWILLELNNAFEENQNIVLEYGSWANDEVELWQKTDDRWHSRGIAGNAIALQDWPLEHRYPAFTGQLRPGTNQLLFRVKTKDIIIVDAAVDHQESFRTKNDLHNLGLGGFFAICLGLAAYNLVIFFVNRRKEHILYFLYLTSYALAQSFLAGLLKRYLLPDSEAISDGVGFTLVGLSLFFTYWFVYEFLDIKTIGRKSRILSYLFFADCLLIPLIVLMDQFSVAATFCIASSILASFIVLGFAIHAVLRKHPVGGIFLVAWISLIIGNIIQSAQAGGLITSSPLTRSAVMFGAALEAILISYALAVRFKKENQQERKRRHHAFQQLEKMVYPHQLSLMKQGFSLEQTMPLAKSSAIVLCIDMVDSSKSDPKLIRLQLQEFFNRCQARMSEGYDRLHPVANAFRIKELGDGFLCSIGYPFAPPSGQNQADLAIDLALSFLRDFDQTFIQNASDPHQHLCCVGIAAGDIESFFTLSGIRSYELFGKSIIKATRYQALRKSSNLPGEGHIICLQANVFGKLSAKNQALFEYLSIQDLGAPIRDDAEAKGVYLARILPKQAISTVDSNFIKSA